MSRSRRHQGTGVARIDGVDAKAMRDAIDRVKDKLQNAVVVLGSVENGKVRLAAGVTKNNTDRIRAGDLDQLCCRAGRRQGRRPSRFRAGRRHQPGGAGRRPGLGLRMGF